LPGVPRDGSLTVRRARPTQRPRGTLLSRRQLPEEVLDVRDKTTDPKAPMPATESQQDDFLVDEIEVEDLAIDGICGVY
jgi:mycofactocin precursor